MAPTPQIPDQANLCKTVPTFLSTPLQKGIAVLGKLKKKILVCEHPRNGVSGIVPAETWLGLQDVKAKPCLFV